MHDMVKRGRNHPGIIVNSLCNEVECNSVKNPQGVNVVGVSMVNFSKALDPTRPTTANSDVNDGLNSIIDVQGFSHAPASKFAQAHQTNPTQPLVLSECCSCTTQRVPRAADYACMTEQNAPGDLPYVSGSLGVWTLFDYFGEPPGLWPFVSSSFGQMDLAGFPKNHAYWYTANWRDAFWDSPLPWAPTVRVLDTLEVGSPPITPGGLSGVTSAPVGELFVDGVSLGTQPGHGAQMFWKVPSSTLLSPHNCSWPVNQTGVQCKGLTALPSSTSPASCQSAACAQGVSTWQWGSSSSGNPPACWVGTPNSGAGSVCPPPGKPGAHWVGASREPSTRVHNATLWARDASGGLLGSHTVLSSTGSPTALLLYLDVPNVSTATGSKLVLDGADVALVRVALVDSGGVLVSSVPANVTFSVVSGPGRLGGVGSGDPSSHEQPNGAVVQTFGGVARALFIVNVDCTSSFRDLVRAIDSDSDSGPTMVLAEGTPCPTEDIVIAAVSPGLPQATIHIPVSAEPGKDGVLQVAKASTGPADAGAVDYLKNFVG